MSNLKNISFVLVIVFVFVVILLLLYFVFVIDFYEFVLWIFLNLFCFSHCARFKFFKLFHQRQNWAQRSHIWDLLSDKKQREKKTRTKQNCESEKVSKEKCVCLEQWLSNHMVEIQWHIVLIFIAVFSWFFVSFCFCCFVCCCAIFKSLFLLVIVVVVAFWVLWKSFLFCFVLFVCDCANCCWLLLVVVLCCLVDFCCCCCFVFVLLKMKLKFNLFCCLQQQTVKISFFKFDSSDNDNIKSRLEIWLPVKRKQNTINKRNWNENLCFVLCLRFDKNWVQNQNYKLKTKSCIKFVFGDKKIPIKQVWNDDQRSSRFVLMLTVKNITKTLFISNQKQQKKWKCQCGCCRKNLAMTWEDDTVSNEQLASLSREYFEGKGFSSFKEHLFAYFSFGGHSWMLSALCSSRSPVSIGEIEKPSHAFISTLWLKDHHEQNPCHPCSVLCAQKSTSDNNGNSFAKRATTTLKTVFQVNGIQLSLLHFWLWAPKSTLSFFATESTKSVAWFCLNFKCELNWIQIPLYFGFCFVGFFVVGCLVCGSFVEIDFCLWDILKFDTKAIVHFRFIQNSGFNFQKDLKWKLCLQTQHKRAKDTCCQSLVHFSCRSWVSHHCANHQKNMSTFVSTTWTATCTVLFIVMWESPAHFECLQCLTKMSECAKSHLVNPNTVVWRFKPRKNEFHWHHSRLTCHVGSLQTDDQHRWPSTIKHCHIPIQLTLLIFVKIIISFLPQKSVQTRQTEEETNLQHWQRKTCHASQKEAKIWCLCGPPHNKRTCVHKRKIWFGCFRHVFVLFETTIWIWNSSEINDYFCVKSEKLSLLWLSLCLFLLWFCCCCILFLWLIFTNLFCEFFWICFVFLTWRSSSSSCFIRGKTERKGVTSEILFPDKKQREKKTRTKQNCESEKVSKEKCVCLEQWLSNHMVEIQWHIVLIFIAVFSWFFVSFCFCCFVCCCAIFKSLFLLVIVVVVAFWVLWKSFLFCFVLFVCDCANCCWLLLVVVLCCLVDFCCCCCFVFVLLKMKLKFNLFCCLQQQTVKIKFFQIWLFWQRQHKVKTWNLIACEKKTKHNQQKKLKWEFVFCFVFEIWQKLGPKSKLQIENKILHQICFWWQKNSDQTSLKWRSKKFKVCFDAHSQKYHKKPSSSTIKNSKKIGNANAVVVERTLQWCERMTQWAMSNSRAFHESILKGKDSLLSRSTSLRFFRLEDTVECCQLFVHPDRLCQLVKLRNPSHAFISTLWLKDHHEQNPCHPCSVLCAQKSTSDNNGNSFAKRATTTLKTVFQVNGIQLSLLHFWLWASKSTLTFFETESKKVLHDFVWISNVNSIEFKFHCILDFVLLGFCCWVSCVWFICGDRFLFVRYFEIWHQSNCAFQIHPKFRSQFPERPQMKIVPSNTTQTCQRHLLSITRSLLLSILGFTSLCQPSEKHVNFCVNHLNCNLHCSFHCDVRESCSFWVFAVFDKDEWMCQITSCQSKHSCVKVQTKKKRVPLTPFSLDMSRWFIANWWSTQVTFHNQTLPHPNPIDTSHLRQNHHLLPPTKECANKTDWRRNESAALTKKNVPCKPKRSENLVFVWSTTQQEDMCSQKKNLIWVFSSCVCVVWNHNLNLEFIRNKWLFLCQIWKISLLWLSLCLFLLWFCCCCILFLWLIFYEFVLWIFLNLFCFSHC